MASFCDDRSRVLQAASRRFHTGAKRLFVLAGLPEWRNRATAASPLAETAEADELAGTPEPFEIELDMPGLTTHMLKPLLNTSEDA